MPRLRLNRSCRLLFYVWLGAVAFWSFLPSPTIPPEHVRQHIDDTLNAGLTLTTTVADPSFSDGIFVARWRLSKQPSRADEKRLVLQVGDNPGIDLSELLEKSNKTHVSKAKKEKVRTPWFEGMRFDFKLPWIREVDCADVCLPWFDRNDQVLLTYQLHGGLREVAMTMVVDDRGVMEVWPASYVHTTLRELNKARRKPEAATYGEGDLMEEALEHLHKIGRPLLQLDTSDMEATQKISVPYLRGSLPSRMHRVREVLLANLEPVVFIMLLPPRLLVTVFPTVLFFVLIQGGLACAGITLSCWLRDGRPPFSQWSRKFWATKWVYIGTRRSQGVWGPAGPLGPKPKDRSAWTAKGSFGLQRPKTARFGRGWDAV